jgi:hypothetical protein
MNWMIREMLRNGVYEGQAVGIMAPYSWASSMRVRDLFKQLGSDVGDSADKNASRAIYEFVVTQIGPDYARFDGDFDLPLQLITRKSHRAEFVQCFANVGREAPRDADSYAVS